MVGVHTQHIAFGCAFERHLDVSHAINAVGCHPGKRHVLSNRPLDHRARQCWLGGKANAFWHMGCRQVIPVIRPALWQIERPIQVRRGL